MSEKFLGLNVRVHTISNVTAQGVVASVDSSIPSLRLVNGIHPSL